MNPNVKPARSRTWNVAIVHPTFWPYVRRGTERFMAEWSQRLAAAGHRVTILTSKPGASETVRQDGVEVRYERSLWRPYMAKAGVLDFHVFPLTTFGALMRGGFDIVHTFNFTDTLAAAALRRFTGAPVLLHLNTIPPSVQYRRSLSTGGKLLGQAMRSADELLVISRQQREYFEGRFGRPCVRIPAPVDLERFPLSTSRDRSRRTLLCASALDDRRKGGRVLMRAFNEVRRRHRDVQLEICSPLSPELESEFRALIDADWRDDVVFRPVSTTEDLAAAYARASMLVLPSLWEAFPLVVLESLATGTPVVGTSDGGIPELIETGGAGALFDPGEPFDGGPSNVEGLVNAISEVLALATRPETPVRCQTAAQRFSWDALMPAYTDLYARLIQRKE